MKLFVSLLLASVSVASVAARAADPLPPSAPPVATYDNSGLSGIYLRGDVGASYLNWSNTNAPWAYVGGAGIGYQFDPNFRTDLTYNWSGNYGVNPAGNASTGLILGNVYYDWKNDSVITPYVGAGVGYGWQWGTGSQASTQGIAVGLNAGLAYEMTRNLSLDVGYRFHDILGGSYAVPEHQVAAGLRVKF